MREQVVTPRANGRGAQAQSGRGRSGGMVQKPARRGAGSRSKSGGTGVRVVLSYMPLVGKILLAIITGVLVFAGYRAAASASFFATRSVDINGTTHVSADEIKAAVRRVAAEKGVWDADLQAISAEVEKLPWVRKAVVSRVLPDGLRVRVTERERRAVVRTLAGKFVWVDDEAVSLGQRLPTDPMPEFFIGGWDESGTDEARRENQARIGKYLEMLREWSGLSLTERISEVNLGDLHDVRALLSGDDAHIEVRLGGRDFGNRLQNALNALDKRRDTPIGRYITYLSADRDDGTILIGQNAGVPALNENASDEELEQGAGSSVESENRANTPPVRDREATNKTNAGRANDPAKKKARDRKEEKPSEAKKETRPRRAG